MGPDVTRAEWNEDENRWNLEVTRDGKTEHYSARTVVAAAGPL